MSVLWALSHELTLLNFKSFICFDGLEVVQNKGQLSDYFLMCTNIKHTKKIYNITFD